MNRHRGYRPRHPGLQTHVERFDRIDPSRSAATGGNGLGLKHGPAQLSALATHGLTDKRTVVFTRSTGREGDRG